LCSPSPFTGLGGSLDEQRAFTRTEAFKRAIAEAPYARWVQSEGTLQILLSLASHVYICTGRSEELNEITRPWVESVVDVPFEIINCPFNGQANYIQDKLDLIARTNLAVSQSTDAVILAYLVDDNSELVTRAFKQGIVNQGWICEHGAYLRSIS
jgi:hypothetical protein